MSLLGLLGVGLVKGAKYLYKHRNEISTAASVVRNITESSGSYASDDYEEEYTPAPALPAAPEAGQVIELNEDQMSQLLAEIAESLETLEANITDNSHRITELKDAHLKFEDGILDNAAAIEKVKQDLVRLASSVNENSEVARKIKADCERQMAEMAQQLKALEDAQAADRKKSEERYGNMCLFLVFGVAVAIALAIFL